MKVITFLVAVLLTISFVSCRKVRTCECTSTTGASSYTVESSTKLTKKEAKTWCEGSNNTTNSSNNCKLK